MNTDLDTSFDEELFDSLVAAMKPYVFPWANYTPNIPLGSIAEEIGIDVGAPLAEGVDATALSGRPTTRIEVGLNSRLYLQPEISPISQLHEMYHNIAFGGQGLHSNEHDHAVETLANRFAIDVIRPLPALSLFAAERTADWTLAYFQSNLEELIRITSKPCFTYELQRGIGRVRSEPGRVDSGYCMLIVKAPEDVFDTVADLRTLAAKSGPDGCHGASCWPIGGMSAYLTQDGLYYSTDEEEFGRWISDSGLLDGVEPPSGWMRVATREVTNALTLGESTLIHCGRYFLLSRSVYATEMPTARRHWGDESSVKVLAVLDEDGELARAWQGANSSGGMGPLLPWQDPLRYPQPSSYEAWVVEIKERYLSQAVI